MHRLWELQLAVGGLCCVAGCNVLVDLLGLSPVETGASDLIAFRSEKELVDFFKGQVVARNSSLFSPDRSFLGDGEAIEAVAEEGAVTGDSDGSTGGDATPPQVDADESFSGTTLQEAGVDESDVIKTDGTYIYMIDSASGGDSVLRIVRVKPAEEMEVTGETQIEGYGRDIYLYDGKVVALTGAGGFYAGPVPFEGGIAADEGILVDGRGSEPPAEQATSEDGENGDGEESESVDPPFGVGETGYVRPYTVVTIIDVAEPAAPNVLSTTRFEGSVSASRMIDGALHLVLSNFPTYYADVLGVLETGVVRTADLADVTAAEVVPDFQQDRGGQTTGGKLLSWQTLFRPTDPDGYGVVTVVSLDVDDDASFTAVGLIAEPGLIYASTQAIYLTDTQWNFLGQSRTTTDIYKFAIQNRGTSPVATGSVSGRILNQYSMGEYQGNLRVATTVDRQFSFNGQTIESMNNVYVLTQEPGTNALSVIGSVEGIAPGETIQSARFVGDRGYVVTFRETDPLFTLDLVDSRNPRVIGELQVPGFSTFLTPLNADHLLAVGRYIPPPGELGPRAVQLSIFDVSDLADPIRSANVILGKQTGANSEAVWNPKAFTYFPDGGMVALPIEIYGGFGFVEGVDDDADSNQESGADEPDEPLTNDDTDAIDVADLASEAFRGVIVFDVSIQSGLTERGRISTTFEDASFLYSSFARGVFIGDRVYAVTNVGIRSATIAEVSAADQSITFETSGASDPVGVIEPLSPDGTGATAAWASAGGAGPTP